MCFQLLLDAVGKLHYFHNYKKFATKAPASFDKSNTGVFMGLERYTELVGNVGCYLAAALFFLPLMTK